MGGNHEMKGFVDGYLRAGRDTELKSLTTTMSDGGFVVPTALDQQIAERLLLRSARSARLPRWSDHDLGLSQADRHRRTPVGLGQPDRRPHRNHPPKFAEIIPPSGELYANPSATQFMLDDAVSTSKHGWRARSRVNSPVPKAPLSCRHRHQPAAGLPDRRDQFDG
jgi:HK97 family phage major capsid protein